MILYFDPSRDPSAKEVPNTGDSKIGSLFPFPVTINAPLAADNDRLTPALNPSRPLSNV